MKTKRLVILGSTGSIGQQTLDVVREHRERFDILALAAGRNVSVLEQQVREFKPRFICADNEDFRAQLEAAGTRATRWLPLQEQACHPDADLVVVGMVGSAGLNPTLAALRAGKSVALANKEVLVMAGAIVTRAAKQGKALLLPVDSEHSAIWQCLWGERHSSIARIMLTASGGAFRDYAPERIAQVTPEEALKHPTWQMGRKITIDSATLMNKGFEAIETRWLFDVPMDRIDIVLHRESIIHSMVEFVDGSVKAQLGEPDMRVPIRVALCYPERAPSPGTPPFDPVAVGALHFETPDFRRFPALGLALRAGRDGGTYPAALAAADEVAVSHFLDGRIRFTDIPALLEDVLSEHDSLPDTDIENVLDADAWARSQAEGWVTARV